MTDGRVVYDSEGRELRSFDAQDGTGIRLLYKAGIKTIRTTVFPSKAIEHRAKEFLLLLLDRRVRNGFKLENEY